MLYSHLHDASVFVFYEVSTGRAFPHVQAYAAAKSGLRCFSELHWQAKAKINNVPAATFPVVTTFPQA